jgi:hypothetical protein
MSLDGPLCYGNNAATNGYINGGQLINPNPKLRFFTNLPTSSTARTQPRLPMPSPPIRSQVQSAMPYHVTTSSRTTDADVKSFCSASHTTRWQFTRPGFVANSTTTNLAASDHQPQSIEVRPRHAAARSSSSRVRHVDAPNAGT